MVTTITLLLVLVSSRHSVLSAATVVVATAAAAVFIVLEQRRPRIGIRPVVAAIGLVLLVAVSLPPRSSNDVWSYTMYGRMVSVHGSSPYQRVPADFKTDPFDKRVSPIWQHRGSVYGPAFVGYAASLTFLAGDSVTVDRLLFQLGALLVVAAVLWLVWRRTRSPSAVAWLGLHPLFGAVIVNNGQIDAFVGLAILAAVLLAYERRGVLAGAAIAAASLVKITGVVALAGVVFWLWRRGERRVAVAATLTTGALVGLVYLPFLAGASHVLNGADHTVTPGSPWNLPAQLLVGKDAGRDLPGLIVHNSTLSTIFYLSLALTAVLGLGLAWRWARAPRPDLAAGVATASYVVAAEYTLPWYAGWALPMFAERRISRIGWVVWAQAAVLLAAWRLPTHHTGGVFDTVLRGTFAYALPIVLVMAFAFLPYRAAPDEPPSPAAGPAPVS
ncbi:MAG TPA: glycosyltransferase 87 family protein [Acidimicrobiia bacterium]|nr:glycosyltransferase 87 family protein [Acidimicrobiia bacterium]